MLCFLYLWLFVSGVIAVGGGSSVPLSIFMFGRPYVCGQDDSTLWGLVQAELTASSQAKNVDIARLLHIHPSTVRKIKLGLMNR